MQFDFSGNKILVTGATGGIGLVTAQFLRAAGAEVVAAGRALTGVRGLDGLVNGSGVAQLELCLELRGEHFDRVMEVNARGAALVARRVAAGMIAQRRAGSIVNASSQAALVALGDHLSYCASKAALDAITRLELGPHGIRVNSVNPTVTLTPTALQAWVDGGYTCR